MLTWQKNVNPGSALRFAIEDAFQFEDFNGHELCDKIVNRLEGYQRIGHASKHQGRDPRDVIPRTSCSKDNQVGSPIRYHAGWGSKL